MQALLEELQVVRGERDRAVEEGKSLKQATTALEKDKKVWEAILWNHCQTDLKALLLMYSTWLQSYSHWRGKLRHSNSPSSSCGRALPQEKRYATEAIRFQPTCVLCFIM